eukprot:scaffold57085_cov46-Attheya_sp.AAC.2
MACSSIATRSIVPLLIAGLLCVESFTVPLSFCCHTCSSQNSVSALAMGLYDKPLPPRPKPRVDENNNDKDDDDEEAYGMQQGSQAIHV